MIFIESNQVKDRALTRIPFRESMEFFICAFANAVDDDFSILKNCGRKENRFTTNVRYMRCRISLSSRFPHFDFVVRQRIARTDVKCNHLMKCEMQNVDWLRHEIRFPLKFKRSSNSISVKFNFTSARKKTRVAMDLHLNCRPSNTKRRKVR